MRIDAPTREDVAEVVRGMREKDRAEILATMKAIPEDECEDMLIWSFVEEWGDHTFCAYDGDEPVAVGSLIPVDEKTIHIGLVATDEFPRIAFAMTKFVRTKLFPEYADRGFLRVECASIEGYSEAHKWIGLLGLKHLATHEKMGRNGEAIEHFGKDL